MSPEKVHKPMAVPGRAHFELLLSYGKSSVRRGLADDDKEKLWLLSCEQKGLRPFPLEEVIQEWKAFLYGESKHSSLSVSGNVDPEIVTVSVLHQAAIVASHSTTTKAMLARLLGIYARCFDSRKEFESAVAEICREVTS